MKLIAVGDTTFASDPAKTHRSYVVFTTEHGRGHYARDMNRRWHYVSAVYPSGYKVGRPVPLGLARTLTAAYQRWAAGR